MTTKTMNALNAAAANHDLMLMTGWAGVHRKWLRLKAGVHLETIQMDGNSKAIIVLNPCDVEGIEEHEDVEAVEFVATFDLDFEDGVIHLDLWWADENDDRVSVEMPAALENKIVDRLNSLYLGW